MESFTLGKPALVCRWRLYDKSVPLLSRHLRALRAREVGGQQIAPALVAWVKQHVEWALSEGAQEHPDGVLMLVRDEEGCAAMSVGEFLPLEHTTANDLLARAQSARKEARATGVSPEDLWVVRGEALLWGTAPGLAPSGASSLVHDLACTLGMPVVHREDLLTEAAVKGFVDEEVFLVSDEHGVVPANDHGGPRAQKYAASYQKLLQSKR